MGRISTKRGQRLAPRICAPEKWKRTYGLALRSPRPLGSTAGATGDDNPRLVYLVVRDLAFAAAEVFSVGVAHADLAVASMHQRVGKSCAVSSLVMMVRFMGPVVPAQQGRGCLVRQPILLDGFTPRSSLAQVASSALCRRPRSVKPGDVLPIPTPNHPSPSPVAAEVGVGNCFYPILRLHQRPPLGEVQA